MATEETSKYKRTVPLSSYLREPRRRNKDPDFNVTICMPRVGRNRIHLNHEHNTSTGLKRELGLQRQWPRGNESGKDRHDRSKGHLSLIRETRFYSRNGERSSRWQREQERKETDENEEEMEENGAWPPGEWINCHVSVTSAAMESKTFRLQRCRAALSVGNDLKKGKKTSKEITPMSRRIKKNLYKRKPACSRPLRPEERANRDRRAG